MNYHRLFGLVIVAASVILTGAAIVLLVSP
jgi:hypothetical protein